MRINDFTDRNIVVDSFNEICDILGNINLMEPRPAEKLRRSVSKISAEYTAYYALFISLVKLLKTVCENSICSISEDPVCLFLLEVVCKVKH